MSSETVMLDMMNMLTLLNSGKEEEEEEEKYLDSGSKVSIVEDNNVKVEERDGVLVIGILVIAMLGLILTLVAVYFFRKMVASNNLTNVPNFIAILKFFFFHFCYQVIWFMNKRREQTVDKIFRAKINKPTVLERV